jgi:hypothetical protein
MAASPITKCSICLSVFTSPKLLPCSHTFCTHCIQPLLDAIDRRSPDRRFNCPVCRAGIPVPNSGKATDFQANFYLNAESTFSVELLASLTCKDNSNWILAIVPVDGDKCWVLQKYNSEICLVDMIRGVVETLDVGARSCDDMARDSEGGMYLSDNGGKRILYIAASDRISVETLTRLNDHPRGLAYCADSGGVMLCTAKTIHMDNWSSGHQGKMMKIYRHGIPKSDVGIDVTIGYPIRVAIGANGDFCVVDYGRKCVIFLNADGREKSIYTGKSDTTFHPKGVCYNKYGHILIADKQNSCIHV